MHSLCCCQYIPGETLISPYVRESTKVLDSGSQHLDSGSQHLDSGFQPFGFHIPTFWIPDSIPKWIPDSKPLWIPDSSLWIPDSNSQNLLDSGFRILLHGATHKCKFIIIQIHVKICSFNELGITISRVRSKLTVHPLEHWSTLVPVRAKRSSARFGGQVKHCI